MIDGLCAALGPRLSLQFNIPAAAPRHARVATGGDLLEYFLLSGR